MVRPTRIHKGKQPRRIHFIPEHAKERRVKQADIMRELGVDKSSVSRWFKGVVPTDKHLWPLTGFLGLDEPGDLFRHPDDTWLTRAVRGRPKEEQEQIRQTIDIAFPRKHARG